MIKKYYIPFNITANINYLYLFSLYDIATYNEQTKTRDTIQYSSIYKLAESISLSTSTLKRVLVNTEYKDFFLWDKANKKITLLNNFRGKNDKTFVVLTDKEVCFLMQQKDNLLCKYYIYIKRYCSIASINKKQQDFTAKQFLSAVGYCTNSNNNLSKIASYNTLLSNNNLVSISRYRDTQGHTRNIYTL